MTITVMLSLLACLLILAFLFQDSRGIWQPDEGYYTGTAVTMMTMDSLSIPYLGGNEIFLDKPPMIYRGIIAGLKLFGHSEFAARFFHSLCFILTSVAVGSLSYSMFKDRWLALLSSMIYATMVIPFIAANFLTPDTILTLWTTLLIFGSLPWSAIWLEKKTLFNSALFKKQWWKELYVKPELLFLLCYFFVPLIVLCLASSKLGLYALPIFVPLAIATAKLWAQKTPVIDNLSFPGLIKGYAHPIRLIGFWICLFVAFKDCPCLLSFAQQYENSMVSS